MSWLLAQTEPGREHLVRIILMRARFETYLPRIRHRNRIALLFPTYLFVRPREFGQFYTVRWTPHVTRLLGSGERPTDVSEEVVMDLRKRENRDRFVRLPRISPLQPGQEVRVISGLFEGQQGIYEGMNGRERCAVLLNLLGRSVPVQLPARDLAPIPGQNPMNGHNILRGAK
jgi:transcriptional antiterminator RfaH